MKSKFSPLYCVLLVFLLAWVSTAKAEQAPAAQESFPDALSEMVPDSMPTAVPAGEDLPKVIDRITNPDAYPSFAFDDEEDLLEVWFPYIRDQDCAVFRYQDQIWMLDCGDERAEEEIVPLLQFLDISHVDRLINTHPHHDHLNGLYAVDAAAPVAELSICFPEDMNAHMTAAMEYCKGNSILVSSYGDESVLSMGDGFVTFLAWQKSPETETLNNQSAQFLVAYGNCNMLFMSDLEYQGQRDLVAALSPENLKADLLRYPHHGKSRMVDPLFDAIDPVLTIITNTSRIVEIKASTKFLDYRHAAAAYTHNPPFVIHLQTDGQHWLCDQIILSIKDNSSPDN